MSKRSLRATLNGYSELVATQLGCVTHQRMSSAVADGQTLPHTYLLFTPMKAFPLANRSPLWLSVAQTVRLNPAPDPGDQPLEILGYLYRIGLGEQGSQELLAFHFDPYNEESGSRTPHLHVGRSAYYPPDTGAIQHFHKRHIPTGHVTFPMVVRFLIEELGVEPLNPNWERILSAAGPG